MTRRRHSLSGRLLLLFLLTAVLLAIVVRTGFRYGVEGSFRDLAKPHVGEYIRHLLDEIGDPPDRERAARLAERLPLEIHFTEGEPWSSGGEPPETGDEPAHVHTLADGTRVEVFKGHGPFVIRANLADRTVLLVPRGLETSDTAPLVVVLTLLGVLAVLTLSYHAIRRLFRPVETIRSGVARIGAGELDHRLEIRRRDELGELAGSINAMADDIREMLEAKRELLLAVSHELRSPLTRARVKAELLDPGPARGSLLGDLDELETLLGELLESERLQGRHVVLDRQAVDPTELLRELVGETFSDSDIDMRLDPPGTWLSLDPVRIRLLARNLLRNALQHTPANGPSPVLSSHVDDRQWGLVVSDQGPGVSAEHREHLTEPFYRVDPSRQRASGGVGLGLHLALSIAEAHGGALSIQSESGMGTRVLVAIPVPRES
ncbi:MAG: HAMP domain-containing sensor histidine kinase [Pseudomonadota bacterium]|nr:HAMP domain-containing sensor histidine kinase [Pseudomonadota bacterium]